MVHVGARTHSRIMKAVVFADTRSERVADVPDAQLEEPTDVVIPGSSSAISGNDLHTYDGRTGATPGLVLGHETLGVIKVSGSAVEAVKSGDRVVNPHPPVRRRRQLHPPFPACPVTSSKTSWCYWPMPS
jgi:threonine dehydrogenase-like Zn-dependent dehydrogenase